MPIHRPSKGCVTITTAIALAFCMRIWMTGVFGLIDVGNMESGWIKVDALVVGRNSTTFGDDDEDGKLYWCARVEFMSHFGENITAISATDCFLNPSMITLESYIPILYNPAYPKEFIEQDVLESELTQMKVMVGVGVAVSLILSGVLCLLLNRQRHRPPEFYAPNEWELTRPMENPEERKEKILAKLYLVTVPEDSSNIAAASIRSMGRLDVSDRAKEGEEEETENAENGDNEKEKTKGDEKEKSTDDDNDDEENDTSLEQNQKEEQEQDSTKAEDNHHHHHHASSTISSFLSNLILGPSHEAECCICLDRYEPGEVVCASKSEECNHVFHKECLMDWMMKNNDRCPLCRVDFMKDEEEGAGG